MAVFSSLRNAVLAWIRPIAVFAPLADGKNLSSQRRRQLAGSGHGALGNDDRQKNACCLTEWKYREDNNGALRVEFAGRFATGSSCELFPVIQER